MASNTYRLYRDSFEELHKSMALYRIGHNDKAEALIIKTVLKDRKELTEDKFLERLDEVEMFFLDLMGEGPGR